MIYRVITSIPVFRIIVFYPRSAVVLSYINIVDSLGIFDAQVRSLKIVIKK